MAITITATVGSASANSYITLSDANSIVEGLILDDDVSAWDGSSTDNKNRALYTAAQRIDRERFLGARVSDTQALQWPRSGVRKPDTYTNAQVVLAVFLNNNRDGLGLSGLEDFSNVSIGSLNVTPNFYGAVGADRIPPLVERYLSGIRISGPGNISIRRS